MFHLFSVFCQDPFAIWRTQETLTKKRIEFFVLFKRKDHHIGHYLLIKRQFICFYFSIPHYYVVLFDHVFFRTEFFFANSFWMDNRRATKICLCFFENLKKKKREQCSMPIFGIVLICYGQFDVCLKHTCITASIGRHWVEGVRWPMEVFNYNCPVCHCLLCLDGFWCVSLKTGHILPFRVEIFRLETNVIMM